MGEHEAAIISLWIFLKQVAMMRSDLRTLNAKPHAT
jgi:hypothetical protein